MTVSLEEHARVKAQLARVEAVLADLLNEQSGSVTPPKLQQEMLVWLRNAEAVSTFLKLDFDFSDYDRNEHQVCVFCLEADERHELPGQLSIRDSDRGCPLLDLWRVLGDERYQKTMDAMFERWCAGEARRESAERNAEIGRRRNVRFNFIADPNTREGHSYIFQEGLVGVMQPRQLLTSPNDKPVLQGIAAWLPERGILDKDGNDPNAQLYQIDKPIITK